MKTNLGENVATPSFDCRRLRETVLRMAYAGSTSHIACAFSVIEILAVLYRHHLRYPEGNCQHPRRDYLVLSKGHGVMAQYACMYEMGWLSDADVDSYFHDGTRLMGEADAHVPGLEATSGSLGHGLSVGVGLALAAKRLQTDQRVFVVVGDGEINEGAVWEGLLFAAQFKLDNLMVIVDANGFQGMGPTDEVLALGNISEKFRAFGFETRSVNGHDESALDATLRELMDAPVAKPLAVVAQTVKGHGVSFIADGNRWHYARLTADTYAQARAELQSPVERVGT